MAGGGKVTRVYDGPDGKPLADVEGDDGAIVRGVPIEDLEADEETQADEKQAGAPSDVKFFQYELEAGVVTINELRASKGLEADARFGAMTLPEYIAANAKTYKIATLARTAGSGEGLADGDA